MDCGCASTSRSKRVHTIYVLWQNKKSIFEPFNSGDDLTDQLFVATIQMCNELVFLCLQNHLGVFQSFVKQPGSLLSNLSSILNKRARGSLVAHLI